MIAGTTELPSGALGSESVITYRGVLLGSDINAPAGGPSPGVTFDSAREIPRDSARRTTLNDPDALDDSGALFLCVERRFRLFACSALMSSRARKISASATPAPSSSVSLNPARMRSYAENPRYRSSFGS